MTQSEALDQAAAFNDLCRKKPWLDFDLVQCSPQFVVMHCGIDLSIRPDIELRFDDLFFASLLMTWKTDTSSPVFRVLTGEEAVAMNTRYRIEQGYHLFIFQPEYVADDVRCVIAARAFSWQLLSVPR